MLYAELTAEEKSAARVMFLIALNDMEYQQAIDAGKTPKPYRMCSPLFKQMIKESEWERYTDENGCKRIRRLSY